MVDVGDKRPANASLTLDDQVITLHPDCRFFGDQPGDLGANNEMILSLEDLDRGTPRRHAFLPLPYERLRDVKRDFNVNC